MGGILGNGISSGVLVFKHHLEYFKEVVPCLLGDGYFRDSLFAKGVCLSQDRSFDHVGQSEGKFLSVNTI